MHDAALNYSGSKGDHPQVVRLLLEHGANANARSAEHVTPLLAVLIASSGPNLDVARILLEHGADIDAEDEEGRTPWRLALKQGGEIIQLLSEFRFRRAQFA